MEDGNTVAHICFFGVLLSYCSDNTGIPDHSVRQRWFQSTMCGRGGEDGWRLKENLKD